MSTTSTMRHTRPRKWHVLPTSHYVLLSLFFLVALELVSTFHQWFYAFIGVALLLLIYGIILIRIEEKEYFQPIQIILPSLAAIGLWGFSLLLPRSSLLHVYFVSAAIFFFWLLKNGAKQAYPTWNWALSAVVLVLDVAVIIGLRSQLYLPMLPTLLLAFLASWLLSLQAFSRLSKHRWQATLISVSLAITIAELVWVLQFLPIHYLVQAGIVLSVYYAIFHIIAFSLTHTLQKKTIFEYAGLSIIAISILLLTARWL